LVLLLIQLLLGGGEAHGLDTFLKKLYAVTVQAPWLIPYEKNDWMLPAAQLFLLIPFFYMSWKVEFFIWKKVETKESLSWINDLVFKANISTYGGLAFIVISFAFMINND